MNNEAAVHREAVSIGDLKVVDVLIAYVDDFFDRRVSHAFSAASDFCSGVNGRIPAASRRALSRHLLRQYSTLSCAAFVVNSDPHTVQVTVRSTSRPAVIAPSCRWNSSPSGDECHAAAAGRAFAARLRRAISFASGELEWCDKCAARGTHSRFSG